MICRLSLGSQRIATDVCRNVSQKAQVSQTCSAVISYVTMSGEANIKLVFHCFTVHFNSLSFIHTNSCTFSYNYVSVQLTPPHSKHYRRTKHMLPHNHDGWLYFLNVLIIFNISNIDKEVNKELPEDDLIEDRNMLECFLKCFKWF